MRQMSNILVMVVISIPFNTVAVAAKPDSYLPKPNKILSSDKVFVTSDFLTAKESTYYFSMTLPEQAGKRFARLSITEQSPAQGMDLIRFDLKKMQAFLGTPDAVGQAIALKDAWIDETGTIWVEFNQPLTPKTKLTLALKTQDLPAKPTYEFGIAAYPAAKPSVAVFVGNGILRIN